MKSLTVSENNQIFLLKCSGEILKEPVLMVLTTLFETGIKHPIMQPIDGIEPAIGCLVSFEYGYCYNK